MAISVRAYLAEVSNSKGVKGADEEGRVIGKTSSAKRAKEHQEGRWRERCLAG
jgi:hypothetical protein